MQLPDGQRFPGIGSGIALEIGKVPGAGISVPLVVDATNIVSVMAHSPTFTNTGTSTSGGMSGNAGSCAITVMNTFSATKSGLTMQGAITLTDQAQSKVLGTWHFSATLQP